MAPKSKVRVRKIPIDHPNGDRTCIAGADHDAWNDWLTLWTSLALPLDQNDEATAIRATTALYSGMIDMKPADPIEGIIISQLMAANQSSLAMYHKAWTQPEKYFEARTKYLALADKAARTVVMLTERLDQHRGRGQQQITVKHVTVNANQAVVTDQIVSDKGKETTATKLLTAGTDKAMEIMEPAPTEAVPAEGGGSKAK